MEGEFSNLALVLLLARAGLMGCLGLLFSVGLVVLFGLIAERRARRGETSLDNGERLVR
jgi:hypothetical protein